MLFNSIQFLLFFPIVILIYFVIPKKLKMYWLLMASYYFYMCWNYKYAVLIFAATLVTYLSGIWIKKVRDKGKDNSAKTLKWLVAMSFIVTLGILFVFKYLDLAIDSVNTFLNIFHISLISNPFSLLLPVGISFYTFQTLGYVIDVYRGDVDAEKNFFRYALFVSFFPQLVAGPIERSKNLLGQIRDLDKKRMWNYEGFVSGFGLMLYGLFMKMVIADRVSLFVDGVYNDLYLAGTVETVLAAVGFSIQIYTDFAGYSAIAIGAARMMGFNLMENFNTPYLATSIADFWHRWHISLSTWFRDYLYIPLGGNRKGKWRKYLNLMITFWVSGLWHGAAWHYVVWGGIHGFYQVVGDLLKPVREKCRKVLNISEEPISYKIGQIFITYCLTTFAWIFFRSSSMLEAAKFIKHMITRFNPWVLFDESLYEFGLDSREVLILLFALCILIIGSLIRYKKGEDVGKFLYKQNLMFRWIVFLFFIISIIVFGEYGVDFSSAQFIYFAF